MAHKKSGGSKARQGGNVAGKRLGLKVWGGQRVQSGQIIVRQRGSTILAGENVGMGRDFTIFAKKAGIVRFDCLRKGKKKAAVS